MATRLNILANSSPSLTVRPDGDGDSDQWIQFSIDTSDLFIMGSNDTDDTFHLCLGDTLTTNDVMFISTAGEITLPLQPAFEAYIGSNDLNVTGDGTMYTIGTNVAWTERFDQNGDFDTNGTFTAPVTGKYSFKGLVRISDIGGSHSGGFIKLTASNVDSEAPYMHPANWRYQGSNPGLTTIWNALEVDMDAGDTMTFVLYVSGGTPIIEIEGSGSGNETVFSGYLAV